MPSATGRLDLQHHLHPHPDYYNHLFPLLSVFQFLQRTSPSSTLKYISDGATSLFDCLGSSHDSLLMSRMKFNFYFNAHSPCDWSLSYLCSLSLATRCESFALTLQIKFSKCVPLFHAFMYSVILCHSYSLPCVTLS